ncbi:MAG: murein L,D-transpeptidase catalytic domain family protein [Pseudomonadota bacterium]|nr:murein L,D-transpeptidase catalytic domain family protein [Pseudomonadota bacterium]
MRPLPPRSEPAPLLTFAALMLCAACADEPGREAPRDRIARAASSLSGPVLEQALDAFDCATRRGELERPTLAVIDFSRSSLAERLWLIDVDTAEVVRMRVTHGQGSGGLWATAFSNESGSRQSSLGLYRAAEAYVGEHGRSLRLDGLEPVNDRARDRSIVIHAAEYATLRYALLHGHLGRSWGCPAVAPDVSDRLIDALEGGGAVFAWYPDERWLSGSAYLRCK